MTGWSLSDLLLAFTLTCLALIPIIALIYWAVERRVLQDTAFPGRDCPRGERAAGRQVSLRHTPGFRDN